jgi:hypothetical protein
MFQDIIDTFYSLPQNNLLANLPVYPADYRGTISAVPFLKLNIVTGKANQFAYRDNKLVTGLVIVSIYYPAGSGQKEPTTVANSLDLVFQNKFLAYGIQTNVSSLQFIGPDPDDSTLSRADYSVPFSYYGE